MRSGAFLVGGIAVVVAATALYFLAPWLERRTKLFSSRANTPAEIEQAVRARRIAAGGLFVVGLALVSVAAG